MIKIIETNILFKDIETPTDVQSRVIEADSWDNYVSEIKDQKQINRHSIIGNMYGVSFPKNATIKSFKNTDKSLICMFYRYDGVLSMKTAYICN